MVKLLGDVLAETITSTSGRDTPTTSVIGVGPEEIADGSFVWSFLDAVKLADLVKGVNTGRETTVETEDLVLNHCRQGEVVEQLSELFPHVGISVLPQALIVETVPGLQKQD